MDLSEPVTQRKALPPGSPNDWTEVGAQVKANDIGKVAFKATPLRIVDGELWLERHGRQLKFRRVKG
jgi:hypothetical protein